MALKDIAIAIRALGVAETAAGMKTVGEAAENMGRKVNSASARSSAGIDKLVKGVTDSAGAAGRVAAGVEEAAAKGADAMGKMGGHAHGAAYGMTALEQGLHGVVMRVFNLTMAASMIAAPFVAFLALMKHGIGVVDDFAVSVIQIAAQLTQMQAGKGGNLGQIFQQSAAYAGVMAEKLEEIDANSFASNKGLMAMLQTMTMQGVVLDVNNKKQVETFTSLSNAIAMYTQGQNQEIQARQEMRSLLTGEIDQNSQLARIIDTQIKAEGIYKGGLKEVVELGRQHHDTIERLAPYLQGINAASGAINQTWAAAASSIETAVNKVTREGFKETYADIVALGIQFANWLKESTGISEVLRKSWLTMKGVVVGVVDILRGPMGAALTIVGGLTGKILDGWGLLLSSVFPVLADEFRHLLNLLNAAVNLGYSFGLIMLDAVGAVGSAMISVGKAAIQALSGDFEGAGETLKGMFSGVYVDRFKENMEVVKGTVIAINEEWGAMQNPFGRMLDLADKYLGKMEKAKKSISAPPPPPPPPEEDEMDLEAYEREVEKFREAYRALHAAEDKAAIDQQKNVTNLKLAELKHQHEQGLLSERKYLDEKYAIDAAASKKEIDLLTAAAARAQEAVDKAKIPDKPADGSDPDQVDRYNNAVLNSVKAQKELVEAQQKLNDAVAKGKQLDIDYHGATWTAGNKALKDRYSALTQLYQITGNTVEAVKVQIDADQLSRVNLDEMTKSILKQVDAWKLWKAQYDLSHSNDELRDEVAIGYLPEYAQQEAAMEASYQRQIELEKQKYAAMIEGTEEAAAQYERLKLLEEKHTQDAAKMDRQRWMSATAAAADSIGKIGEILMEGNRDQFEAGKAMMMGQAIIAAALAIVQCYTQLGPIGGTIAAVGVAAATAAELVKIENTEYQPRAMGGPVSAGGYYLVGEQGPELIRMGSAGTVIPNNALAQAGEAQLKATRENTRAINRVADGFTNMSQLLDSQQSKLMVGALSTPAGSKPAGPLANLFKGMEISTVGVFNQSAQSFKALFDGNWAKLHDWAVNFNSKVSGFSSFFGTGNKWVNTGSGLYLMISNGQVGGASYLESTKKGGWFTGDKHKTDYSAMDPQVQSAFSGYLGQIRDSIATAASFLGQSTDFARAQVGATKITTAGKSSDVIAKELEDFFKHTANALVSTIGGAKAQEQLAAVTHYGEDSFDALMRITIALQAVNEAALRTGNQLISTAQDMVIANAGLASSLVESFGGVDKFMTAIDKYNKVVNSDEAYKALKVAAAHREIAAALAGENVAVPQTVAQYKKLVESTDMTSPLYKTLIDLSDQFGVIGDSAQTAADGMKSLQQTLDALRSGDSPNVSPESRYNLLSTRFGSDAALASAGNAEALSRLSSEATSFLNASRDYYGSSRGYQDDYLYVTGMLQKVMEQVAKANDLDLPQFATGTPRLASDLTARVHQNEMIIDAQSAEVLRRYGIKVDGSAKGDGEELAELKKSNEHLAALVRTQAAANKLMIEKLDAMERRLTGMENSARRMQAA